jgi:hypothetical protein
MYLASILLCLPLPLSLMAGLILGMHSRSTGQPISEQTVLMAGALCTWAPIIGCLIVGFTCAKSKVPPPPPGAGGAGFEVKM